MQVDALVLLEFIDDPPDKHFVDVVAAKVRIAVRGFNFDNAFADLENRNIESAAAEVENGYDLVFFLIEAIRQRRRRRLVDNSQDLKSRDLAGVLGCLALSVIKV